jgi:hypothetical protein
VGVRGSQRTIDCVSRISAHVSRRSMSFVAVSVAAFVVLALSSSALAAPGYQDEFEFGQGDLNLGPTDIAVAGNGDVLIANPRGLFSSQQSSIAIFEPGPAEATLVAEIPGFENSAPFGLAVDQTNEDVYVSDPVNNTVTRYTSSGTNPPTYSLDSSYPSPESGTGPGQIGNFAAALTVDPATGDLLVADTGNRRVDRYGPDGKFISAFDGSAGPAGAFSVPQDLVVQPNGDIDVLNLEAPLNFFGNVEGASTVERFEADGTPIGALDPSLTPQGASIGFDPETGDILVGRQYPYNEPPKNPILNVLHNGVLVQEAEYRFAEPIFGVFSSRAPAIATGGGRIYGLTSVQAEGNGAGTHSVQVFETVTFPDVSLADPANVTTRSVRLTGDVNPGGVETSYAFELSTDAGTTWTVAAEGIAGPGTEATDVEADLTGLTPLTRYQVRLKAENAVAKSVSPTRLFETLIAPPTVATLAASETTPEGARLRGSINPEGAQASFYFEYGATSEYGVRAPLGTNEVAGNGRAAQIVSLGVRGLAPGTLYHYRIVGTSPGGTSVGEDMTVTTASGSGSARRYELVSATEESNVSVSHYNETGLAGPGGNSLIFGTQGLVYSGAESNVVVPRYRAVRSSDGWAVRQIDPPTLPSTGLQSPTYLTLAVSEDQTRALVASFSTLAPSVPPVGPGELYLYLRDLKNNEYTYVARVTTLCVQTGEKECFVGGSADLSTIVFLSGVANVPGVGGGFQMYRWEEGKGLSVAAELPNGEPFESEVFFSYSTLHTPNIVSRDGNSFYYSGNSPENGESALYLREGSALPKLISASQRHGDAAEPVPARLMGASTSGRFAVFLDTSLTPTPLTEDAPPTAINTAYRYDRSTGDLEYVGANVSLGEGSLVNAESGRIYYFDAATEALTTAAHGVVTPIGSTGLRVELESEISPDGRFMAFMSRVNQTSFDSHGKGEIYRFDSLTGDTVCLSCRSDGHLPAGESSIGQKASGLNGSPTTDSTFQNHFANSVADDGRVFFDTAEPLVASDVNGKRDVYAYEGSAAQLVSPGDGNAEATLLDATPNGSDLFFVTEQSLVVQDRDQLPDVYDARVGGGFAELPDAAEQPCAGEACRPSDSQRPAVGGAGSELVGSGAASVRRHKAKQHAPKVCTKKKHKKARGRNAGCGKQRHGNNEKGARS